MLKNGGYLQTTGLLPQVTWASVPFVALGEQNMHKKTLRIMIRCEVGGSHGMGHAVRCRALARALATRGADIEFLTITPELAAFVSPFPCFTVTDTSQESVFASILGHEPDVAIFDTKAPFDEALYPLIAMESACPAPADHKTTIAIVRIDHPHATPDTCDLLVAPVAHWDSATVQHLRQDFGHRFLYGWDYVVLDEKVTQQAPIPYVERAQGPLVFCAGGSDPTRALEKMAEWCGEVGKMPERVFLLPDRATSIPSMYPWASCRPFSRQWLQEAALVVSLFGVTIYESLWYQTPVLSFARDPADVLYQGMLAERTQGAIVPCGLFDNWTAARFAPYVSGVYKESARRERMSDASVGFMDGHGVQRVADAIIALGMRT